eukprot:jgi/Tetstr1/443903/TSEL_031855.t1
MVKENYQEIYETNKGIRFTSDKMYIGLSPEVCRYRSMKLDKAGHTVVGDTSMHKLLGREAIRLLTPDEPASNWGKYLSDHIIDWELVDKVSDQQAAARLDCITKFRAKVDDLDPTGFPRKFKELFKGRRVHKDDRICFNTELCKTCIVEGDFKAPARKQFLAEGMPAVRAKKATVFIADALFGADSHTWDSKDAAWGTDDFNDLFAFAKRDNPP